MACHIKLVKELIIGRSKESKAQQSKAKRHE